MDRLASLRILIAVTDNNGFRAAAQRLRISPAMVSKHVAQLEDRLGLRLLNRNSRHVSLTEEGEIYVARARRILEELEELDETLTDRSAGIRGNVSLTAPVWMANPHFVAILASFMHNHPLIRLDINLSGRRANLLDEGYDLALRVGPNREPGHISRVIGEVQFHLLASPALKKTMGDPQNREDLCGQKLLAYAGFADRQHLFFGGGADSPKLTLPVAMSSENETLLRLAALEGLGIAFLPDWLIAKDLANGKLVKVLSDDPGLTTNIHAVYPSRRLVPSRVRALIDHFASARLKV
ncbi:LysR family transcriptional regulator [Sphingobium sp. MK2]|uniref:LysR family transcriptional regulator n=1 Tax=Sphingobium sp. MK2 TaxID=3116540 RepID=UPI0032E36446